MARNTNYPYDPYAGEVPMEGVEDVMTVGSIARELTSPVNWFIWKYQYLPGTYSMTKGISVPFGGMASKLGVKGTLDLVPQTFNAYSFGKKGFWNKLGAAGKTAADFGRGSWNLGESFLNTSMDASTVFKRYKTALRSEVSSLGRIQVMRTTGMRKKTASAISEILTDMSKKTHPASLTGEYIEQRLLAAIDDNPKLLANMGITAERWTSIIKGYKWDSKLQDVATKTGLAKNLVEPGALKVAGRLGFKGLMLGGKIFAGFGAVSLAWDVGKMVMEPVGRYLVENANRVGLAYQNRFMPEMGGKIAMSYMASGAATERQRAVEAISRSYINGRSAIGNEAQFLHG